MVKRGHTDMACQLNKAESHVLELHYELTKKSAQLGRQEEAVDGGQCQVAIVAWALWC